MLEKLSFLLHKFPLVSKCGFIKKLASESSNDSNIIRIPDFPGGAEGFELVIKFCYDISFEINTENIAMLLCAAEYLEMTEEHSVENLVETIEVYLNEVILKSLSKSVKVLQKSQDLLPIAERVRLVDRCIDSIAYAICQESQSNEDIVDWWADDLAVLKIDMFRRVLVAMIARGFKRYSLGPVLKLYAEKALRGLDIFGKEAKKMEAEQEHEKRLILETIVSLLPRERNSVSVSFLSILLRAAIYLETTVACRLDLEKRMGLQLRQAVIDDLLIPYYSFNGDNTMLDVDTVQRILMNYLEFEVEGNSADFASDIGELMETYLAEIASDRNINFAKFIGFAECIPKQSRMYRAIDIFLKTHPNISEVEKKKVCSLMDCKKLSRDVYAHAAQNDRFQENLSNSDSPAPATAEKTLSPPELSSYKNELSKLNRENQYLKLELLKVKMKFKELEKEKAFEVMSGSDCSSSVSTASVAKPRLPRKSFINSVSQKLGKLINPFGLKQGQTKQPKSRRHSIS
ncbi:Phototropic-responsive NPH3 family protein [Arabidopsis thaliana]|uniref:Putative BTB/POZ domain-containing protein At3g49970 n=1 Tax=Arabidopsis thaliana TaxID=3702 RepID=Y3997_ARATH|nr:Phototropic-responsive NPH3 family protein [Arabidopsis thaliana]NP_001327302.1 Phototropic-responsive NPH3 family protein [Arabidopsis thaliana]Q9SN21.2 RecName: Full=Putative BTB/POZ domain-containing protein At3g49970 [Arabidopsis thaliana]AEE78612.2 Phototropic-responsive NPH3 family protein [Arabidopsis thaliana]ANM65324.1 Phototropic-responsive NPH3 family protein [Arabidopsis thaliana]|eukprot:NP_001319719.1 Phototropic-responsive NPH3 family protein [Arabidopsis thaliana]